eukprot:evm.model.scf_351.6 EVM.evm.TU.scf_351.6   scf_351:47488-50920(-)
MSRSAPPCAAQPPTVNGGLTRLTHTRATQRGSRVVAGAKKQRQNVEYGGGWYDATREYGQPKTVKEQLDRWRKANYEANKGLDRKDLYTENWAGSEYRGSKFNILTLIGALFVLTPVAGLVFAYLTYGKLWG